MAFSARLSENTVADDDPVVFENVGLNIGEGCDEFSGRTTTSVKSFMPWL